MNISKLTITQDELNEAVEKRLSERGLKLRVEGVERTYGTSSEKYEVNIEIPELEKASPAPAIKSVEELGTAIEEGKI